MMRLSALLISITVLTGCHGPQQTYDPFAGQSRMPPFDTGSGTPGGTDPYYPPPVGQQQAPPADLPKAHQSSASRPKVVIAKQDEYRTGSGAKIRRSPMVHSKEEALASRTTTNGSTDAQTSGVNTSGGDVSKAAFQEVSLEENTREENTPATLSKPINILRPNVHHTEAKSSAGRYSKTFFSDGSQEPSRLKAPDDAREITPPAVSSSTQYSYHSDYSALIGRLEYSAVDKQWKLRYIPIDEKNDEYGGSVILSDASKLEGFKVGNFVKVTGKVGQQNAGSLERAPHYHVDQIQRLEP